MGFLDFLLGGEEESSIEQNQSSSTSKASSQTTPISPEEVAAFFQKAMQLAGGEPTSTLPAFDWKQIANAPAYNELGATPSYGTLTGGDYNALESALSSTALNRLATNRETDRQRLMADLRARGIADDPAALKLQEETIDRPYNQNVSDILSNAAATRYGLQSEELGKLNELALGGYNTGANFLSNLNQLLSSDYGTQAGATTAENVAREQGAVNRYTLPRDYWLNKVKSYYGGTGTKSSATSESESTSTGSATSAGESHPGLAKFFEPIKLI